jgi:hypothetical protein
LSSSIKFLGVLSDQDISDPYCQWWTVSTYADFLVA